MAGLISVKDVAGPIFGELIKAVLDAGKRVAKFKPTLDKIKTTLDALKPVIEEIDQLYDQQGRADEVEQLTAIMKKGSELVRRCLGFSWWEVHFKWKYQQELTELDESLKRFVSLNLTLQMARNVAALTIRTSDQSFGFTCSPPKPPQFTVGLDVPLNELKTRLFHDASSVLVLSAPAGSGKTTLAKKLCWDEQVRDKFKENIFFVTFSQNPKLEVIVGKLLQTGAEHVQQFASEDDAINQLESALRQIKKFPMLLVIDDVWVGSEVQVKKFEFHLPDYKILLTSRFQLEMFGTPYCLEPLKEPEAIALFRHSACLDDSSFSYPLEENEAKILKACGGSPFVLEVIGGSLHVQSADERQSMVRKLSKVPHVMEFHDYLLRYLLDSLDVVGRKVNLKECFADLGLFPEDHRIPASALIDMWVELHELDEDGTAMNNIWELGRCNLAKIAVTRKLPWDEGNYHSRYFVTQHDILRALAIHQSSQGPGERRKRLAIDMNGANVPKGPIEQKQQELAAQILSISTGEKTSARYNIEPSQAEVLILNLWAEEYNLPEFMEKMSKLKVLIMTNYGYSPLRLKNCEFLSSLPNLKRIRLEQVSLPSSGDATLVLQNLQKLSLFMCNTTQAFGGIADISLLMPNLVEINIDYCDDIIELPAMLFDSVHLKRLSITNCHKLSQLPEEIGKLKNLEMLRLASCTDLEELPESIVQLDKLRILDISDCINIETLREEMGKLCHLRTLYISGCSKLIELPPTVKDLKNLKDIVYDEPTSGLWEPFKSLLPSVRIHERKVEISFD